MIKRTTKLPSGALASALAKSSLGRPGTRYSKEELAAWRKAQRAPFVEPSVEEMNRGAAERLKTWKKAQREKEAGEKPRSTHAAADDVAATIKSDSNMDVDAKGLHAAIKKDGAAPTSGEVRRMVEGDDDGNVPAALKKKYPELHKAIRKAYGGGDKSVQTGPKGGRYYLNANGEKTYVK